MPMSVVHVADLCDALIQIADRGVRVQIDAPSAGIYYITSGRTITYGELGQLAAAGMGSRVLVLPTPRIIFWLTGGIAEVFAAVGKWPTPRSPRSMKNGLRIEPVSAPPRTRLYAGIRPINDEEWL